MKLIIKFEFDPEKFIQDAIKAKRGYEYYHKNAIGNFFEPTVNIKWIIKWSLISLFLMLLLLSVVSIKDAIVNYF